MEFKLHAPYKPTGDQPRAIEKLVQGFEEGNQFETLVGVTGRSEERRVGKECRSRWSPYH